MEEIDFDNTQPHFMVEDDIISRKDMEEDK